MLSAVLLFSTLVSSVVITYPDSSSFHLPHLTATFGPQASLYSVSGDLVADYTLLCGSGSSNQNYFNQIVLIERGVCSFTDKALNAQSLGAIGVIIGGNDDSDTLGYLGSAPGSENVHIPTVYVSGKSYQKLTQIIQNYGFSQETVQATLNSVGEAEGTIGWLNPLPSQPQPVSSTGDLVDPNPTAGYAGINDVDPVNVDEVGPNFLIVWIIVGLSIFVKCCIVTIACRRRYCCKSNSSAALLTEGEVAETPVVYATSPAPSAAFTVSSPGSGSVRHSASSLSNYPSIQYSPLMPQATAPSDVYAYDLEKQVVVIRG